MHTPPNVLQIASGASLPAASDYAAGQMLYDGNTGAMVMAELIGATMMWLGDNLSVQSSYSTNITSTTNSGDGPHAVPSWCTKALLRSLSVYTYVSTTNDGANYWTATWYHGGANYGGVSTGATPDATGAYIYHLAAVNAIVPVYADGASAGASSNLDRIVYTKVGSPGAFTSRGPAAIFAPILE